METVFLILCGCIGQGCCWYRVFQCCGCVDDERRHVEIDRQRQQQQPVTVLAAQGQPKPEPNPFLNPTIPYDVHLVSAYSKN